MGDFKFPSLTFFRVNYVPSPKFTPQYYWPICVYPSSPGIWKKQVWRFTLPRVLICSSPLPMTQHNLLPSHLSNETPSAKIINSLPLPNSKDTIQFLSFWTFLPYLTSPKGTLSWNFILLLLFASSSGRGLFAWVLSLSSFLKHWYSPGPVYSHLPPWESSSQIQHSYPSPETTKSTLLALAFPLRSRPHVLVHTGYSHLEGSHHCLKLNSVAQW